jgi:XcyI restriction endonuclease
VPILIPAPQLQVDFALALEQIRGLFLQEALSKVVASLDVTKIDAELAAFAPASSLAQLAGHGLRGELMFAVPCVLRANPRLLGYYRLLLGFSQKAFYTVPGVGRFRSMEEAGALRVAQEAALDALCSGLAAASSALLEGIGARRVTRQLLDDLALLTVGPQLRGGYNVRAGTAGILRVFGTISAIVAHAAARTDPQLIELKNAAGRRVLIRFASDPDIRIQEEIATDRFRNIVAIEVKAGIDFSNIHNRIGEAEKSHQKAKADGYVERWTVVNVDRMDTVMARRESPSTDRFYRLSHIDSGTGDEYQDFYNRLIALTGIVASPPATSC